MAIANQLSHSFTDHSLDLAKVSASLARQIRAQLLSLLKNIKQELLDDDVTDFSRAKLTAMFAQAKGLVGDQYDDINTFFREQMGTLGVVEATIAGKLINDAAGTILIDPMALQPLNTLRIAATDQLTMGAPSSAWWDRQADDTLFRFQQTVRNGIAAGKTNQEIVSAVSETIDRSTSLATALVRTSVQTVANAARVSVFKGNPEVIKGIQQASTLDERTSEICMDYDLQTWDLDGEPIGDTDLPFVNDGGAEDGVPRHWNCRSVLIPIVKSWQELGVDIGEVPDTTRASMDGQVASGMSFADWMDGKTAAQQDAILGPGKADLFREGKLSQSGLLDQSGNPLSLAELQSKHGVGPK